MKNSQGIISFGVLIWMSYSVGPWWIGVILFLLQLSVNLASRLVKEEKKSK